MEEKTLVQVLDQLTFSTIKKHDIDFLRNTISFELLSIENAKESNRFTVVFDGVSSLFYVNDSGEDRFQFPPFEKKWSRLELSDINYCERTYRDQIRIVSDHNEEWAAQFNSEANFLIEMDNAVLLIEAQSIIINGEKFDNLI